MLRGTMDKINREGAGLGGQNVSGPEPDLHAWFVREVLPLEAALRGYLRNNRQSSADISDLLQDIYVRVYEAARKERPVSTRAFVFTTAHNLLVNRVKREKIVPLTAVENLEALGIASEAPAPFADTKSDNRESHTVIDFTAGKDVGLGMFGRDGTSTINAGVRFAQFSSRMTLDVQARPTLYAHPFPTFPTLPKYFEWDQYSLSGHADRSFHGVGPSLSWNGSAGLLGNHDNAELMLDWSVNAAVLFGRQKASTSHSTKQRHEYGFNHSPEYPVIYQTSTAHARSRSVAVPNLGGAIGFSVKYPNAKVSFGYRADFFFGAMDTGIDTRHTKDVGFHGPFATISIGLGG